MKGSLITHLMNCWTIISSNTLPKIASSLCNLTSQRSKFPVSACENRSPKDLWFQEKILKSFIENLNLKHFQVFSHILPFKSQRSNLTIQNWCRKRLGNSQVSRENRWHHGDCWSLVRQHGRERHWLLKTAIKKKTYTQNCKKKSNILWECQHSQKGVSKYRDTQL